MKAIKHQQAPIITPPPTFDLIGLTAEEAKLLYDITNCGGGCAHNPVLVGLLNSPTKSRIWRALDAVGAGRVSA